MQLSIGQYRRVTNGIGFHSGLSPLLLPSPTSIIFFFPFPYRVTFSSSSHSLFYGILNLLFIYLFIYFFTLLFSCIGLLMFISINQGQQERKTTHAVIVPAYHPNRYTKRNYYFGTPLSHIPRSHILDVVSDTWRPITASGRFRPRCLFQSLTYNKVVA